MGRWGYRDEVVSADMIWSWWFRAVRRALWRFVSFRASQRTAGTRKKSSANMSPTSDHFPSGGNERGEEGEGPRRRAGVFGPKNNTSWVAVDQRGRCAIPAKGKGSGVGGGENSQE